MEVQAGRIHPGGGENKIFLPDELNRNATRPRRVYSVISNSRDLAACTGRAAHNRTTPEPDTIKSLHSARREDAVFSCSLDCVFGRPHFVTETVPPNPGYLCIVILRIERLYSCFYWCTRSRGPATFGRGIPLNYAKAFGRRLKSVREAAGLTQERVAERAHTDAKYMSALENGRNSPTLDTIMALARALNVAADDILSLEG